MALIGEPGLGRNLGESSRGVDQLLFGPLDLSVRTNAPIETPVRARKERAR